MSHAIVRTSPFLAVFLGFLCSLLAAAEMDLLAWSSDNRSRSQRVELVELVGLSGFFSLMLASLAIFSGRAARRERNRRAEFERVANLDPLTGIANRRQLLERLDDACRRLQDGRACALLLLDLDGFKAVNDTYGHAAGDRILIHVARQLNSLAERGCLPARLGGDEFALLVEGPWASPTRLQELALELRSAIAQPVCYAGGTLSVGASIGIAQASERASTSAAMLEAADIAMYRVKRSNRDRFAA